MSLSVASGSEDAKHDKSSAYQSDKSNSLHIDFMSVRAYVTGMASYISSRVTLDTVRPLNMFLGISGPSFCFSPEAFNPPVKKMDKSTYEKFKSRLRLNFAFFLSNYAVVTAGVALVTALMHPGMLMAIAFVWGLWAFHTFLISNELVVFGTNVGTLVSISHRSNALVLITTLVIVWKCLVPAITVVIISGLIILAHALFRDPKHIDTSSKVRSSTSGAGSDDDSGGSSHDSSEVLVEKPAQV